MLIVFLLIAGSFGLDPRKPGIPCDGMIFRDVYYDRELLFENIGKPYNLIVHKFSSTLYFSHTVVRGNFIDFKITYCHVNKRICRDVDGIPGGYAIAYDAINDDMYFGGHDGIYKLNFLTKTAEFFTEKGKSIWGLFVRKNFYYIEYPNQVLYVFQNTTGFVKVPEAFGIEIDNFFISKSNNIYISNKTALYKIEPGKRDVIHLDDRISVRQIVEDRNGLVYFVASDGIYMEDHPFQVVRKIAIVEQAYGLAFDENDRVIYSNDNALYRLHMSPNSEICYYHIFNKNVNDDIGPTPQSVNALKFAKDVYRSGFYELNYFINMLRSHGKKLG